MGTDAMQRRSERGYSLIELLIVVGLLALVAALAVPAFNEPDEEALDRAAAEVVAALRFARAEAIRTSVPHGVEANPFAQRVRVYRLDESVSPPAATYDVYDPFTKQPYDRRFGGNNEPRLTIVYFKYANLFFPQTYVGFSGETGVPKLNSSGTIRLLETGFIDLWHNDISRRVNVSPVTGRVTVQ